VLAGRSDHHPIAPAARSLPKSPWMPISAHKSLVPISRTSTPGTAAISAALAIAVAVSSITMVRLAALSAVTASLLLAAAIALTPLGPGQQARLAAWLDWATAYRDCYVPAPFSLSIDEDVTARCIERTLRLQPGAPPEQRAATEALIAATPQLITMLNTPAGQHVGDNKSAKLGPPSR
jgi:hypothetical protein